jgi:hypothetical protein
MILYEFLEDLRFQKERENAKRKMCLGAVFGLFNAKGRPAHELLVGRPIVRPGQWVVFVQKSRAFLQEIMREEVGLRVVFCQSSRIFSQNGLGLADLGRPRAPDPTAEGRWRRGHARRPLLLRESYIEIWYYAKKGWSING